jgi:hypothetical protein
MQAPAAVQQLAELYGALVRRHHRHLMIEAPCSPFASACERCGDPPRLNKMIGYGGAGAGAPTLPHLARRAQIARTDRLRDEGGPASVASQPASQPARRPACCETVAAESTRPRPRPRAMRNCR